MGQKSDSGSGDIRPWNSVTGPGEGIRTCRAPLHVKGSQGCFLCFLGWFWFKRQNDAPSPLTQGRGVCSGLPAIGKCPPHCIMGTTPKAPEIRRLGEHLFLVRSAAQGCYLPQFQEALLGEYLKYYKCCFSGVHALRVP